MLPASAIRLTVIIILSSVFLAPAYGQYGNSRRKRKSDIKEKIWFGVNLNNLRFGSQTFSFGLSPMAAVDVNEFLSLGFMLKMSYRYENLSPNPPKIKFETLDVGPTIFARAHFLGQFFMQVEYERGFFQVPIFNPSGFPVVENNVVLKENISQNYFYVGAGYASGNGPLQFIVSIHYNVLDDFDYVRIPWDYRFGVRWNLVSREN